VAWTELKAWSAGLSGNGEVVERLDLVGAFVAVVLYVSSILTFSARMMFGLQPGHWIGVPLLLMAFPLAFLMLMGPRVDRPFLYYLQLGLMLTSIVSLLLLDYVLEVEWRDTQWVVVSFVMLYFAGLGGMIGVASLAGRGWTISAVVLFLVTLIMAFVQRSATGL
jgi:hypothetical protein